MVRWQKNITEFEVGVINLLNKNCPIFKIYIIPKPIIKLLDNPDRLKFIKKGRNILSEAGDKK